MLSFRVRKVEVTSARKKVLRSTEGLSVKCPRQEVGKGFKEEVPYEALGCHLGTHELFLSAWGLQAAYVHGGSRT